MIRAARAFAALAAATTGIARATALVLIGAVASSATAAVDTAVKWSVKPAYESPLADTAFTIPDEKGQPREFYTHSYAVIIAEGRYQTQRRFPDVSKSAARAESLLRPILEKDGFHVVVWRDLKSRDFTTVLNEVFTEYGYVPGARLFFYYFGHGTITPLVNDQSATTPDGGDSDLGLSWLVPIDAPDSINDEDAFVRNAVRMATVADAAKRIQVKHAFFAFEACKAGDIIRSLYTLGDTLAPPPAREQGYLTRRDIHDQTQFFLTAGNSIQDIPIDNSFTRLLADGLSLPAVDTNGDGYVTGKKLIHYVSFLLPQSRADYPLSPQAGLWPPGARGDMVFGPVRGVAKPAPPPAPPPPVIPPVDNSVFELTYWNSLDKNDPGQLQAYIDTYGERGRFGSLARAMLAPRTAAAAPVTAMDARTLPATTPAPVLGAGARPAAFQAFRDCGDCLDMVALPGGTFTMGSPKDEPERFADEDQVRVSLPAFAISRFPVTRGQYAAFAAATDRKTDGGCWTDRAKNGNWASDPAGTWRDPAFAQDDSHPVVCVNWDDAMAYAAWMKARTGEDYRLLSESEYEYADRAGTQSAYFWGSDAKAGCPFANMADATAKRAFLGWTTVTCDDGYERTSPVGHFAANPWGLFDATGNVSSWVADCFADTYAANPKTGAPAIAGDCSRRVVRGGSWGDSPRHLRSAARYWITASGRGDGLGFRLARTLSLPTP